MMRLLLAAIGILCLMCGSGMAGDLVSYWYDLPGEVGIVHANEVRTYELDLGRQFGYITYATVWLNGGDISCPYPGTLEQTITAVGPWGSASWVSSMYYMHSGSGFGFSPGLTRWEEYGRYEEFFSLLSYGRIQYSVRLICDTSIDPDAYVEITRAKFIIEAVTPVPEPSGFVVLAGPLLALCGTARCRRT